MFRTISVITAVLVSLGLISAAFADTSQYGMSLHSELTTTANGAITTVPQANVDRSWDVAEKQITEVAEGVYRIAGWGIGNVIAIEGPEGWLIIDTGDDVAQATEQRAALEVLGLLQHGRHVGGAAGPGRGNVDLRHGLILSARRVVANP